MTSPDPLAHLEATLDVVADVAAGIGDDQWAAPTPCAGWDVSALVGHLRDGTWWCAGALGGPSPDDDPGAHPAHVVRVAGAALLAGFSRPGALDEALPLPLGEVPGSVALHLQATEALVHAWDLATATGQALDVDDAVAEEALGFTVVGLDMVPADRSPFAPPRPVPDDAPALDRLVALLGRDPSPPAADR